MKLLGVLWTTFPGLEFRPNYCFQQYRFGAQENSILIILKIASVELLRYYQSQVYLLKIFGLAVAL